MNEHAPDIGVDASGRLPEAKKTELITLANELNELGDKIAHIYAHEKDLHADELQAERDSLRLRIGTIFMEKSNSLIQLINQKPEWQAYLDRLILLSRFPDPRTGAQKVHAAHTFEQIEHLYARDADVRLLLVDESEKGIEWRNEIEKIRERLAKEETGQSLTAIPGNEIIIEDELEMQPEVSSVIEEPGHDKPVDEAIIAHTIEPASHIWNEDGTDKVYGLHDTQPINFDPYHLDNMSVAPDLIRKQSTFPNNVLLQNEPITSTVSKIEKPMGEFRVVRVINGPLLKVQRGKSFTPILAAEGIDQRSRYEAYIKGQLEPIGPFRCNVGHNTISVPNVVVPRGFDAHAQILTLDIVARSQDGSEHRSECEFRYK